VSQTPAPPLAFDERLPERDRLLEEQEVRMRLSARLGADGPLPIDRCERVKAKYRVGESLRTLHRVTIGGSGYVVAARTFPDGRSRDEYGRAAAVAAPCGPLPGVAHDPETGTVFWSFPNDRKIGGLRALTCPETLAGLLRRPCLATRLVAYAPERAATARCLGSTGEPIGYAKLYAGDDGRRTYRLHEELRASLAGALSLRLPRALAYSGGARLLVVEPMEGRQADDLAGAERLVGYRRFGAALATLHGLPPPELPRFSRLDRARLLKAAELIGRMRPDVARAASDLATELVARCGPPAAPPVCLHGDVNSRNWILQDDRVALIDLDQVTLGPAAADLGGVLAGLRYRGCVGQLSRSDAGELARAFLAGYAGVRALPERAALRWHTAAALLVERALRAVNRVRAEGLLHLEALLAEASALLREDRDG
jgi:aminoglycoside phosphotransferase (APT) family kinase protein